MNIGFVLFPQLTQLDLTGPLQVFSRLPDAECHLIGKTRSPVVTDTALSIPPTTTFETCPKLDVLVVPGGQGVAEAIGDQELINFVAGQGAIADWITSVCTGAFILGAAGLLQDKRATTHWAYKELLPLVGASPGGARVIRDGNVVTGGGVTAGLDFALTMVSEIAGPGFAQTIQLTMEYDPAPPFDAGDPKFAPEPVLQRVAPFFDAARARMREALGK